MAAWAGDGGGALSEILGLKSWFHLLLNPHKSPTPACCPSAPESHLPQKLQGVVSSEPLGEHLGSRGRDVVVPQPGREDRGKLRQRAGQEDPYCPLRPRSWERGTQGVWPRWRNGEERVGDPSEGCRNQPPAPAGDALCAAPAQGAP